MTDQELRTSCLDKFKKLDLPFTVNDSLQP